MMQLKAMIVAMMAHKRKHLVALHRVPFPSIILNEVPMMVLVVVVPTRSA